MDDFRVIEQIRADPVRAAYELATRDDMPECTRFIELLETGHFGSGTIIASAVVVASEVCFGLGLDAETVRKFLIALIDLSIEQHEPDMER